MNMKSMSDLGQAPETWSLLPCPLTLGQMKLLRQLRHAKLIDLPSGTFSFANPDEHGMAHEPAGA
jgi:hypothetical protein